MYFIDLISILCSCTVIKTLHWKSLAYIFSVNLSIFFKKGKGLSIIPKHNEILSAIMKPSNQITFNFFNVMYSYQELIRLLPQLSLSIRGIQV